MSTLFSKALVYLGLVDEDQSPGEVEREPRAPAPQRQVEEPRNLRAVNTPEGRRVEPPAASSRTAAWSESGQGVRTGGVRAIKADVQTSILVVEEFGDAKILADWVRDRVPVVLDLRRTDHDLTRRVVDFSSGLIYALDGKMRKVGDGLILVTPADTEPSDDEKRRLQALGAYELPLDD